MRFSTTVILTAVAVSETLASPTHAHLQRHAKAHAKKDVDWDSLDWDSMGIDWTSAWAAGQKTAQATATNVPVSTTTVAVAVKPTVSPMVAVEKTSTSSVVVAVSSGVEAASAASSSVAVKSSSSDATTAWSSIEGLANKLALTEFGESTESSGSEVSYIGNIGSPQCSNMLLVDSVGDNTYTNTFENTSDEPMTIMVWNKSYDNGDSVEANLGSSMAPTSPGINITLAVGESQVVAFDENTQIGWAQATTDIAASGAFATTWGEANFVSTGCGYDVSAIMNVNCNTYNMTITSTEATCISSMTENMWIGEDCNPEDPIPVGTSDGSCYISAGSCTMYTKMGGSTI
ncbi:hypothetical protein BJ878DRAFT_135237 [Calycina marina]|uniref:Uncharacterized protein n=1 Tax=Calycina marina TaxID=1763456 RepID=A0A9P7Z9M7_9HELO|nr:hypothetical protein BJ878DRAFT_135237 [Calycina marina]